MIAIRPYYDCPRRSRHQLWGVYVDGICVVITTRYPSYLAK